MDQILLQVENLSLSFREKEILNNVSFSLKKGDWLTVIGHNGSGKTSLIKAILHLYETWNGQLLLKGECHTRVSSRQRAQIMSYVPQNPPENLHMRVKDFLLLSRYPYRKSFSYSKEDIQIVDDVIDRLKLTEFAEREFFSLSGGEKQKTLIASALVQEAEIVVLDEPTASLDPSFTVEIMTTLKKVANEKSLTILEVSHDINSAALFSDKILALKDGKVVSHIDADELIDSAVLRQIYDHDFSIIDDSNRRIAIPNYGDLS